MGNYNPPFFYEPVFNIFNEPLYVAEIFPETLRITLGIHVIHQVGWCFYSRTIVLG